MTVTQTTWKQLENTVPMFYQDSERFRVVIAWGSSEEVFDICPESGMAILLAISLDGTVKESEGYDDDPTATFYVLHPNNYIELLTDEERKRIRAFQSTNDYRFKPHHNGRIVNGHLGRPRTW